MRYITSDLHGQKSKLDKLLSYVNFNSSDELYITGDAIDRGTESAELVDWVISTPNVHLIYGNHEAIFCDVYENIDLLEPIKYRGLDNSELAIKDKYLDLWFMNGGKYTYESFIEFNSINQNRNLFRDFYLYLQKCPKYKILNDNILLIHAGTAGILSFEYLNNDELKSILNNLNDDIILWDRYLYDRAFTKGLVRSVPNYTTVIGHTPINFNPKFNGIIEKDLLKKYNKRTNATLIALDLGVNETDMLGLLSLDTLRFFYIDKNKVRYVDLD